MNRLPLEIRTQVLAALCEGASIRATVRMTGVAKNTIQKLLRDVGGACDLYQDHALRGLSSKRLQLDEIWAFCHTKERNLMPELRGTMERGDIWTWTALDADTKVMVSWRLGKRTREDADQFICDLATRIASERVQISTDGFLAYNEPIRQWFGNRAFHGSEVKDFGLLDIDTPERKYSPMQVKAVRRTALWGLPDPRHISTAYVERSNLTMRMSMRRLTRLTNGFSKKAENHGLALALHFMYYNFCRKHQTLKTTPAMASGLTQRIWTLRDVALMADRLHGLQHNEAA